MGKDLVIKKHHAHLKTAFDSYLEILAKDHLKPNYNYLPYDFHIPESIYWRSSLGDTMVRDEIRELTNIMNQWLSYLKRWYAWSKVIQNLDEKAAIEVQMEFLDPIVHRCLLTPTSIRDTLTFVATNAIHQIRLSNENNYKDYLEGDPRKPQEKPKVLSRTKKEIRLKKLIKHYNASTDFLESLSNIDNKDHKEKTQNYRNLNTHSIGPRIGFGITRAVIRSVKQASKIARTNDGTYKKIPIPNKMCVQYSLGGTDPLDIENSWIDNAKQYHITRECYILLRKLISEALGIEE